MLTQSQVDQFQQDGFINGGRILSDHDIAELAGELDRILAIGPDGFAPSDAKPVLFRDLTALANPYADGQAKASSQPVWQILNIWEASPAFERLLYHPFVVNCIVQLTGMKDLQVWHDQVQYKPALAGGATQWHQDAPLWPTIEPMTPVSAWIPFDDADIDNGAMWMVPGSHRWGAVQNTYLHKLSQIKQLPAFAQIGQDFSPPADAPIQTVTAVPWPVKKGEVSFHHSLTWHGSPVNQSPRPRRAIAIHFMTSESRFVGQRGHPMEAFIQLPVGAPMLHAGSHFPIVCKAGQVQMCSSHAAAVK